MAAIPCIAGFSMNDPAAFGIASCLYIIFSVAVRLIKKELKKMHDDFLKELKEGEISPSHR